MADTFWYKQTDKPLFPEVEWSKPERRDQAGRLLIIGGSKQGFADAARAYQAAIAAGAGHVRLILPRSLKNLPGLGSASEIFFASANKSGALGLDAWPEIAAGQAWADWTLVSSDLGHNPETAQLVQKIAESSAGLSLTTEALELLMTSSETLIQRPQTLAVMDFKTMQKLFSQTSSNQPLTSSMGLVKLIEILHEFTSKNPLAIITKYDQFIVVASEGKISTTQSASELDATLAAHVSIYAFQHPSKTFEALTTAICS